MQYFNPVQSVTEKIKSDEENSIIYIFLSEIHADKHADFLPRTGNLLVVN